MKCVECGIDLPGTTVKCLTCDAGPMCLDCARDHLRPCETVKKLKVENAMLRKKVERLEEYKWKYEELSK